MKKLLTLMLCLVMVIMTIAGCADPIEPVDTEPASTETTAPVADPTEAPAVSEDPTPAERIPVEFWSIWTGTVGEVVQGMADDFNASQDKYEVTVVYNGGYGDTWTKFLALPKSDWPELIYMYAEIIGVLLYEDDMNTPLQKFIDAESYDISDVQASLLGHYSDTDGNLLMMPMGNTMVGFFYNADLCEAAGVDPYSLHSFHDFIEASQKVKDATGCVTPFSMGRNPIYYTFPATAQGLKMLDNNNGRSEFPTTYLGGTSPLRDCTIDYLSTIQTLSAKGLMAPFSGSTQDFVDMFARQDTCFMFFTCSSMHAISATVGDAFDFGFLPTPAASQGAATLSAPVGGGGVFIPSNGDDAAQQGAWEFLKFTLQPQYTSAFARNTGYLPITASAAEDPDYQTYMQDVFTTAQYCMDAQANSMGEYSFTPAWPAGGDYNPAIFNAIDAVMADPKADVAKIADEMAAFLQEQIDLVNMAR